MTVNGRGDFQVDFEGYDEYSIVRIDEINDLSFWCEIKFTRNDLEKMIRQMDERKKLPEYNLLDIPRY